MNTTDRKEFMRRFEQLPTERKAEMVARSLVWLLEMPAASIAPEEAPCTDQDVIDAAFYQLMDGVL